MLVSMIQPSTKMPETYTAAELQAELAKIREAYPSLPVETCERYAIIALTNKHKAQEHGTVV